jgi:DNA-binding NarL/FixJ family response regulator
VSPVISIVLAEHHNLIRQAVRLLLEAERDFTVVGEVADGLRVVSLVQRRKPRVLILGLAMPGLNSFEVILRVRQRSPAPAVIVLSMYNEEEYVVEALRCGASGYVVTQANGAELIRAVRKVAAGGRYLSAPLSDYAMDTWLRRVKIAKRDPYDTLSHREREIFSLVTEGHSSANIANRLSISRRTAESHRANVMRKLHLGNQVDLIRFAFARGLLILPSGPLRGSDRVSRRPSPWNLKRRGTGGMRRRA